MTRRIGPASKSRRIGEGQEGLNNLLALSSLTLVFVYRVREVNSHRLTSQEARDVPEATVWRAISARRSYGHWEYVFDDYVLAPNLGAYLAVSADRGAERITLHKLGLVRDVLNSPQKQMRGTTSLTDERKIVKLEEFIRKKRPSNR